jgi:hypothetical protein
MRRYQADEFAGCDYLRPHISQQFVGGDVAHALLRAASALLPTLGADRVSVPYQPVEKSQSRHGTQECVRHNNWPVHRNFSGILSFDSIACRT